MPVIMTMMIITLVHGHPKVSHQEALTLEGRLGQISGSSFWQRAVSKSRRAALRRTRVLHRPRGSAESNYIYLYIYIYTYRERDIYTYIYVSLSLSLYIYVCIYHILAMEYPVDRDEHPSCAAVGFQKSVSQKQINTADRPTTLKSRPP